MLSIGDIKRHSFTPQKGGRFYDCSEVDSFFSDVTQTLDAVTGAYEKAKRDNEELINKIKVLSNKIEEYRSDEDNLRSALLIAQRAADSVMKEAKEEAEKIVGAANEEAQTKIDSIKGETDSYVSEKKAQADEYLEKASEKHKDTVYYCSDKTVHYYDSTIRNVLEAVGKEAKQVTTEDIRLYLDRYQLESSVSKVTIDNIRRILSSFFSWLEAEDYIIKNPMKRIHKVKTCKTVKETYSDEALELMRDHAECIRDLAIIDTLASTGMRIGELVLLNRDDVNFEEGYVNCRKANKQRKLEKIKNKN